MVATVEISMAANTNTETVENVDAQSVSGDSLTGEIAEVVDTLLRKHKTGEAAVTPSSEDPTILSGGGNRAGPGNPPLRKNLGEIRSGLIGYMLGEKGITKKAHGEILVHFDSVTQLAEALLDEIARLKGENGILKELAFRRPSEGMMAGPYIPPVIRETNTSESPSGSKTFAEIAKDGGPPKTSKTKKATASSTKPSKPVTNRGGNKQKKGEITPSSNKKRTAGKRRELLVYPAIPEDKADDVIDAIKKAINPDEVEGGARGFARLPNEGVLVLLEKPAGIESLRSLIQAKPELKNKIKVAEANQKTRKIVVYGLPSEWTNEVLHGEIGKKNPWFTEADFELSTKIKSKDGRTTHWVFNCTPEAHQRALEAKAIKGAWERYRISAFHTVLRCYRCQEFGHMAIRCTKEQSCHKCAKQCTKETCTVLKGESKPRCINCQRYNGANKASVPMDHAATDAKCPQYLKALERLKTKDK